ncbi:FAD-dependent oxidoreductase [Eubacteriaceae bacterium ES3]|nr:FAD-dependent oxidoreductase [Eubacteriaceae bacterium ES3]
MKYDVVVVGGGLAGLTSAAYLSKSGVKTLLIEKNNKTGGLVNSFWHQGFSFDAGIRAFENSGILFPMLRSLNIDIEFVKNPISIGVRNQWTKLDRSNALTDYTKMLKNLFPNNTEDITLIAEQIKKAMHYMNVIYGIDNPLFLDKINDLNYIIKTLLPWMLRYQINISRAVRLDEPIYSYLKHFTDNDKLIDIIAQHFFKATPSFFALSYFSIYQDYHYPAGGTGTLAQKITDYIIQAGGSVLCDNCVTVIYPQKHEIMLSNESKINYQKLIWAADQKTLYEIMRGNQTSQVETQRAIVARSSGGDSILTLFIGVNLSKEYFLNSCGPHAFYTPDTLGLSALPCWQQSSKKSPDELLNWLNNFFERTTYEISCPAIHDDTLAPPGKTGLIISTLIDYNMVKFFSDIGQYEFFKQHCIRLITKVLEQSLFKNLRERIIFSLCSTPLTIERETKNTEGAITGWAFTNHQIPAENRLPKIANSILTPINDIYQCGQWTFSPSGLPISILTGKLAADAATKKLMGKHHD